MPLVSIVVPSYNKAAFLREAIESVLNQDYANIELLVFDDGSTDNTRTVLESFGNRFFWESHSNMGQANTLNKGWQLAKGSILAYLSADDVLLPEAVGVSVRLLLDHPEVVMTYCDFNIIDPSSKVVRRVFTPDFDYQEMVRNVICYPGPGAFFRREAFSQLGGWNPAYRQMPDFEYWLRLGRIGAFCRIPKVLADFRVHDSSLTFAPTSPKGAEEPVRIMEDFFKSPNLPQILAVLKDAALCNAYLISAQLHIRSARLGSGLQAVQKAFSLHPSRCLSLTTLHKLAHALLKPLAYRLVWSLHRIWPSTRRHIF